MGAVCTSDGDSGGGLGGLRHATEGQHHQQVKKRLEIRKRRAGLQKKKGQSLHFVWAQSRESLPGAFVLAEKEFLQHRWVTSGRCRRPLLPPGPLSGTPASLQQGNPHAVLER
ncbi:hypothetical protein TraAM80_01246 [Trypanosoma rangeli]|uniref:Uncharacterized protein n=1 Tax=Trypanosoma rangeli TaxID=5698 RepID=A0A422NZT0_TRYRA|nr:uncharacterized protein TraAM80_01246 [Trypanosoma rangeli]RNF10980.1 hypothetical protein TraAM80_01246 [Trypanosoma rangeli]|eukprot:RNF10980.1 hypothetical protein TraAM80_01246 [Trypanosoma rangeli]